MSNCHCFTCKKKYHSLGIVRHRAVRRGKSEDCIEGSEVSE